jgi:uncharacterized protein (TIGR03437 family)
MFRKLCRWIALLSFTAGMACAQNFLLGVNYSEFIPTRPITIALTAMTTATDSQGDIYLLFFGSTSQQPQAYYVEKLSSAGDSVVYLNAVAFAVIGMAVDPSGNLYLAGQNFVEKFGADGATSVYKTSLGQNVTVYGLAVDSMGRAYIIGVTPGNGIQTTPGALQQTPPSTTAGSNAFVVRLNSSGAVDYATYLGGSSQALPLSIAVDASGSAFVAGSALSPSFPTTPGAYLSAPASSNFTSASFLARLSPEGSSLIYSTFTGGSFVNAVALDASDHAVVLFSATGGYAALRFNAEGTAVIFSKFLPGSVSGGSVVFAGLAEDQSGNTYLALPTVANYTVKNSLASCDANGSAVLTVLDDSGNVLQSTYISGSNGGYYVDTPTLLGLGANSSVYVVGFPNPSYVPTRQLAGSSSGNFLFLASFSQNPNAQTVQLACVGNAGSYDSSAIVGGEIVSLFGEGLGPSVGTQSQVSSETGFPKQLANVEVTFNGTPGPLLYVQDGQINAIAPWSLQTGQTVQICVVYQSVTTNCLSRNAAESHPGVFTVDGYNAAAINQDGTLNSPATPAQVGSIVSIFATGLGALDPQPRDGAIVVPPLPSESLPIRMYWLSPTGFIGSIPVGLEINYAGPAPYEVAGVSQINFVVQDTVQNGVEYGLFLSSGGTGYGGFGGGPQSPVFQVYVAQ